MKSIDLGMFQIKGIVRFKFTLKSELWRPYCPSCDKKDNFRPLEFLGDFNRRGYFVFTCSSCKVDYLVIVETADEEEVKKLNIVKK